MKTKTLYSRILAQGHPIQMQVEKMLNPCNKDEIPLNYILNILPFRSLFFFLFILNPGYKGFVSRTHCLIG